MILSPITTPWAQWSYDHAREKGFGESGNAPLAHLGIQFGNFVAHTAGPLYLTGMGKPNIYAYAYEGIDPLKHGMKAAMKDRRAFQIASSPAYQLGAKAGKKIGLKTGARVAGKIGARLVPGLGWAMLAYDAYDLVANQRLFGVEL
jgi:hypothetical protein